MRRTDPPSRSRRSRPASPTLKAASRAEHLAELDQHRIANLVAKGSATQSRAGPAQQHARQRPTNRSRRHGPGSTRPAPRSASAPTTRIRSRSPRTWKSSSRPSRRRYRTSATSLARLGIPFEPKDARPRPALQQILRLDSDKPAWTRPSRARRPRRRIPWSPNASGEARPSGRLDDDKLRLSYTEVRSEIAGYVQDRTVHPGDRVEPGQTLISVRPDLRLDRRQFQGDADP